MASQHLTRELLCWSVAAQDAVCSLLRQSFDSWLDRWDLKIDAGTEPVRLEAAGAPPASLLGDAEARSLLATQMFGESARTLRPGVSYRDGVTPMAAQIASDAWDDWIRALSSAVVKQGSEQSVLEIGIASLTAKDIWQGRLHFSFAWWGPRWWFTLDASSVEKLLEQAGFQPSLSVATVSTPVCVSPAYALRSHRLAVRVELESVQVSLGQLESLAVGDVVLLPHRLDAPAKVLLDSPDNPMQELCFAWLGQCRGRLALEVTAATGL